MDRFAAMRTFVEVADTGGFAAAGRVLNMSPPAVTRAVATLEQMVGTRLFIRTTRSVRLTDSGQRYLDDCRQILAAVTEAEASAAGSYSTPTGLLSVTAPVLFGQQHILPILTDFLDAHSQLSAQTIFVDRVTNIIDEGIDVAVRIGDLPDSSYSAVRVGEVTMRVCASPDYLDRFGVPDHPSELPEHRTIISTSGFSSLVWRFGKQEKLAVTVKPRLKCSGYSSVIGSAIKGWGIIRTLSYQVDPAIDTDQLIPILEDFEPYPLPVHIVFPEGRAASAKVRAFVDFAAARLRQEPALRSTK